MPQNNGEEEMSDNTLAIAKCIIGERSISRHVYDKTLKELISKIEHLTKENAELEAWDTIHRTGKDDFAAEILRQREENASLKAKLAEAESKLDPRRLGSDDPIIWCNHHIWEVVDSAHSRCRSCGIVEGP